MKIHKGKFFTAVLVFLIVLCLAGQAFAVTGKDIAAEALKDNGKRAVYHSAKSIQYLYGKFGIKLPGTLTALSKEGTPVTKGELQPVTSCFWDKLHKTDWPEFILAITALLFPINR